MGLLDLPLLPSSARNPPSLVPPFSHRIRPLVPLPLPLAPTHRLAHDLLRLLLGVRFRLFVLEQVLDERTFLDRRLRREGRGASGGGDDVSDLYTSTRTRKAVSLFFPTYRKRSVPLRHRQHLPPEAEKRDPPTNSTEKEKESQRKSPHLEELSDLVLFRAAPQKLFRVELVAQPERVNLALDLGRHRRRRQVEPLRAGRVGLFLRARGGSVCSFLDGGTIISSSEQIR